jgi:alkylated DNA repair dioxygenase AlkB
MNDVRSIGHNGPRVRSQAEKREAPPVQFSSFRGFRGESRTDSLDGPIRAGAERLLTSPKFFTECLDALRRMGLVGEQKNAQVLYLVGTSRLLPRPINAYVKGHSATGKNFLVAKALDLFPKDSYVEITSASDKAWHYSADSFENKIVYVQEQNKASGSVHPVRLLISEGKLVRLTTVRKKGSEHHTTERFEAKGPIAALSTTTQDRLEVDDETRHISLWMDDSPEQTRQIMKGYIRQPEPLSSEEVAVWRAVQELLAERTGIDIILPAWFDDLAEAMVDAERDVRLRRYFPAFCQACRVVALLRSYQQRKSVDRLEVDFADFAIAHILFDSVVSESLHHEGDQTLDTAQCVRTIVADTGEAARIQQVAAAIGIPYKRAAERVQEAERAGLIQLANSPEARNIKRFVATSPQQLLPDPRTLFRKLCLNHTCSFHHPLTGELVVYTPDDTEDGEIAVSTARTKLVAPDRPGTSTEAKGMAARSSDHLSCQPAATDPAVPVARPERDGGSEPPAPAPESDEAAQPGSPPMPGNPEHQPGPRLITNDQCAAKDREANAEMGDAPEQACALDESCKQFRPLIIAKGYELQYIPDFFFVEQADKWFARLGEELPWEPEVVTMRGKEHVLTRKTVMFGVKYDYNPTAPAGQKWTPLILELKSLVEALTGQTYEQAACNFYPDGGTGIGWHSDKKHPEMIVSVSFGAVRAFRLAPIGSATATYSIELAHGSLLLIPGKVNDAYKHMVPESRRVTEARINITFRRFPG